MATYTQTSLDQLISQISTLLDDPGAVYWTAPEITLAVQEGMRVFGAYTNYWRNRGSFQATPAGSGLWSSATFPWGPNFFPWQYVSSFPWYDLSLQLPTLRTRTWTLQQMVQDIQFMCLEAANGISGAGMSGQITITSILQAISRGRNRFVLDAHLPISIHGVFASPPPPEGLVTFAQSSVFVHRASWMDMPGGAWTNLWREDAWSVDKGNPQWTTEPSSPLQYSEAELAPLKLQMSPAPVNEGVLEALTVDSIQMDLTNPNATFGVPDEWVHAVKYAALSDMFSAQSQNSDPLRAQYAESRYQQAINLARNARSILRLLVNNVPVNLDSLANLDAGQATWRNQVGQPTVAGCLYDLFTLSPGTVNQVYGVSVDLVQSAPIPVNGSDFIQLGSEDIDNLIDYVTHVLTFKCGGKEFTGTFSGYDGFMGAVAGRNGINAAKIRYLEPLFGQPQAEWAARPDALKVSGA